MAWDKVNIKRDNGEIVEAQAPIIAVSYTHLTLPTT